MSWKKELLNLEHQKSWDTAIKLMQKVIQQNPDDKDAYLSMNYLLMNLLVEEEYDRSKHDWYAQLAKKYFDESYKKFSHDPEFLFYTGITAVMSPWYFGITSDEYDAMLQTAMHLNPENALYKRTYYISLDTNHPHNRSAIHAYAHLVLQDNSPIKTTLWSKGSLGMYIWGMMVAWAYHVLHGQYISPEEYERYMHQSSKE